MSAPWENKELRATLDSAARHIEFARSEVLTALASSNRSAMTDEAVAALNDLAAKLHDLCDDERADHASGVMCEAVEALKEVRP